MQSMVHVSDKWSEKRNETSGVYLFLEGPQEIYSQNATTLL